MRFEWMAFISILLGTGHPNDNVSHVLYCDLKREERLDAPKWKEQAHFYRSYLPGKAKGELEHFLSYELV